LLGSKLSRLKHIGASLRMRNALCCNGQDQSRVYEHIQYYAGVFSERRQYIVYCWQYYFHHQNALSVGQLVNEAYHIMDSTPADIHPQNVLEDFSPLTKGQYPIFNKFPKFIVDYQVGRLIVCSNSDNIVIIGTWPGWPWVANTQLLIIVCVPQPNIYKAHWADRYS